MARVHNLFGATKVRLAMEELEEAKVLADVGIERCAHARSGGKRQVLLVDRETLEAMVLCLCVFFQAKDGIRVDHVTGVQTWALPICRAGRRERPRVAPSC